jgi:hypothetical protein
MHFIQLMTVPALNFHSKERDRIMIKFNLYIEISQDRMIIDLERWAIKEKNIGFLFKNHVHGNIIIIH